MFPSLPNKPGRDATGGAKAEPLEPGRHSKTRPKQAEAGEMEPASQVGMSGAAMEFLGTGGLEPAPPCRVHGRPSRGSWHTPGRWLSDLFACDSRYENNPTSQHKSNTSTHTRASYLCTLQAGNRTATHSGGLTLMGPHTQRGRHSDGQTLRGPHSEGQTLKQPDTQRGPLLVTSLLLPS